MSGDMSVGGPNQGPSINEIQRAREADNAYTQEKPPPAGTENTEAQVKNPVTQEQKVALGKLIGRLSEYSLKPGYGTLATNFAKFFRGVLFEGTATKNVRISKAAALLSSIKTGQCDKTLEALSKEVDSITRRDYD